MSRRGVGMLVGVVALVLVVVIAGGQAADGDAYDPDTTGPGGLSIAVDLAEALGTRVAVIDAEDPVDGYDAILVPTARAADADMAARWEAAASSGASVVLGMPSKRIGAEEGDYEPLAPAAEPGCTIAELQELDQPRNPGRPVLVGPSDRYCFGYPEGAQVVLSPVGAGRIVTLGGPELFTNATLSERIQPGEEPTADNLNDNGPLLAAMTEMGEGSSLAVVRPFGAATGDDEGQSPFALLGPGVRGALAQLGLAALILAIARARRVGRHVDEPLPVSIAGSEHTEAVGELLRRRHDPAGTAALLRSQILFAARRQLGLDATVDDRAVARAVAERLRQPAGAVGAVLLSAPVTSEATLVRLANDLEDLRGELIHGTTVR